MRRAFSASIFAAAVSVMTACGKPPPPEAPAAEPEVAEDLPTWCTGGEKPCRPTVEFAQRLCASSFPGAALFMFQKTSPWQRRYVKSKDLRAKNLMNGTSEGELAFGEEMIVLAVEGDPESKGTKGDASYLLLRWNGDCINLTGKDTTSVAQASPKHPLIDYDQLGPSLQRSLKLDAELSTTITEHQGACSEALSVDCKRSSEKLSSLIVSKVRRGLKLSMPDKRP